MDLSKILLVLVILGFFGVAQGASTAEKVETLLTEALNLESFEEINLDEEKNQQDQTYDLVIQRMHSQKSIEKEDDLDQLEIELLNRKRMTY